MKKTNILLTIAVLIFVGVGAYFLFADTSDTTDQMNDQPTATATPATSTEADNGDGEDSDEQATENGENQQDGESVIGTSVDGRDITAYHFGEGETEILFVGGIHGGYEWNTSLVSYELIDWFEENPDVVPENVSVTVVPALNPDGLAEVVGTADRFAAADVTASVEESVSGRFNANGVDINRNFDCNWQAEGSWQDQTVDAGDEPFSEPESQALRDYIESNNPDAAVVYYSAAGGVYSSSCNEPALSETNELMNTYADASGYPAAGTFDAYELTGDAVDWMAKNDIPGISVLLSSHESAEWDQNQAGIEAVLQSYAE